MAIAGVEEAVLANLAIKVLPELIELFDFDDPRQVITREEMLDRIGSERDSRSEVRERVKEIIEKDLKLEEEAREAEHATD